MKTNSSKKRINIIDLIVVIAIVAVVVVLGAKIFNPFENGEKDSSAVNGKVKYTLEVKMREPYIMDQIKEGNVIYDSVTKEELGKIVSVREMPARVLVENYEEKKLEFCEYSELIDVYVDVETKAKMEYPNIIIDEISLKIGKQVGCVIGDAAMTGTIVGLDYDTSLLKKKEEKK